MAVWGTDVPYLRSVESPGEEDATHYTDTVTFQKDDFAALLSIDPTGDPEEWVGEPSFTAGGGVERIEICGKSFTGTQVRKLLSLRSTAFQIRWDQDCFAVETRGYGHRVGMSQYGADAMAVSGSSYQEILAHYYQGTALTKLSD